MRIHPFRLFGVALVASATCLQASGQTAQSPSNKSVQLVTPIFHERLLFALPPTFQLAAPEHSNATTYLHEIPLRGETVDRWTQMVTVTGHNNLALNANIGPKDVAFRIAKSFREACPQTFKIEALPPHPGVYIELIGCGSVPDANGKPGAAHSEVAMIIVLQGTSDYYTLQWAERSAAVNGPPVLDGAKWLGRFQQMEPIKTCQPVAGEKAPYPSCLAQ